MDAPAVRPYQKMSLVTSTPTNGTGEPRMKHRFYGR
jgi:hypothetical protein